MKSGWSTLISSIIRNNFVLQDSWATEHLTLDDAVSHRTGMPRHDLAWHDTKNGNMMTVAETVQKLRHLRPSLEPRAKFQYNNYMYIVLTHIIETLTGKWLGHVLQDTIWHPLDMRHTYLNTTDAIKSELPLATGYNWNYKTKKQMPYPAENTQGSSGASGIISNVIDYAKWVKFLIHQGPEFTPATHQDIRMPRMMDPTGQWLYGLGWNKQHIHGKIAYEHGGSKESFSSEVIWFSDDKYGVLAMSNSGYLGSLVLKIALYNLIEAKFNIAPENCIDVNAQ